VSYLIDLGMMSVFTDELKSKLGILKKKHILLPIYLKPEEARPHVLSLCTRLPEEDFRRLREVSLYLVDSILRLFEKPTSRASLNTSHLQILMKS